MENMNNYVDAPQMGTIMDNIAVAPKNFAENQEQLKAAIDNKAMMEAIAKYKAAHTTFKREYKIGRNDPCPCGAVDANGKPMKYKKCCLSTGKYEKFVPAKNNR